MTDLPDPGARLSDGALRSVRFDDIYFSAAGGLAESRAVFLAGCGLPGAWAGRRHFTIAELGFGTGLNMLAVLDLWQRCRPPGGRLHLFSVEGFLLPHGQVREVLSAFPELAPLAAELLAQWPDGARGWHRLDWPSAGATLDLALMDVGDALAGWNGMADAWFLDGFAPARNPEMWTDAVLAAVARRSAPGARLATYTVAGHVRRALAAGGFAVERLPGFGGKRQRLAAQREGTPRRHGATPAVAIVGAGIAGAALSRAFQSLGVVPRVFASGPDASSNPAALLSPRLDAGGGPLAMLHAQCFRRAADLVRRTAPQAILGRGALRLARDARDSGRFAAILASDLFGPGALVARSAAEVAEALDEPAGPEGLWMRDALVIDPVALRSAWLAATPDPRAVDRVEPAAGGGWRLACGGATVGTADVVCIAAGPGTAALTGLPLRLIRGQLATSPVRHRGAPSTWGHYCIPTADGTLFGATHDRDDPAADLRAADARRNLAALSAMRPRLAALVGAGPFSARAGVRVAARDTQPVAGPIAPGLFVLTGLGGRGFALAPLLAEHLAADIVGVPSPLPLPLSRLVAAARLPIDTVAPARHGPAPAVGGESGHERDEIS